MRWWQKYKKTDPDMNINYGLSIDKSVFNIGENRVFSMLIKGLVIYLLTMGGIGSYLTAIDTPYNGFTLNFTVFITAVICSILYYSYLTENIGYLFFFGIYVFLIYYFRDYINSGFYSVINDTIETISEYLDLDGVTLYNEKIKNTELAVTIAAGVFGVFLNILLNNFISRRVRYIVAIFLVVPLNLIPMYFEAQPDIFYSFMLILGIILSYIMKSSQHFLLHRSERVYEYRDSAVKTRRFGRPKKQKCTGTKTIRYVVDARSMFTNLLTGSLIALGVLLATVALIPESSVGLNGKTNKTRENVLSYVGNFLTLGFAGLFNFYDSTGGLDSGRLGGISAIRFDMQTDLNVTFAPYTDERVYIRNFAGSEYLPYKNMWVRDPADNAVLIKKAESRDDTSLNKSDEGTGDAAIKKSGEGSGDAANKKSGEGDIPENSTASVAKELKRSFDKSKNPDADHLAHGRMDIENVEADLRPYIPYYSDAGNTVLTYGQKESLDFFPDLGDRKLGTTATAGALKPYLNVPHENMESISRLAGLMGLNNDDSAAVIIDKISDYYQKNMPYTLNPGATPRKADFINYFIDKAKKGYCAHFASTAVLLLRYKGIPARYCEGYAIDPETLGLQGEIEKGLKYEDYYQGYNKFGKTRVVKVSATDAEAHAWVEYYDKDYGFRVCEVTPASGDDLSDGVSDIWENIRQFMDSGGVSRSKGKRTARNTAPTVFNDETLKSAASYMIYIIMAAALIFLLVLLMPLFKEEGLFIRSGHNDRLIIIYSRFVRRYDRKEGAVRLFKNIFCGKRGKKAAVKTGDTDTGADAVSLNSMKKAGQQYTDNIKLSRVKNYEDQLKYLKDTGKYDDLADADIGKLVDILNKAGFAPYEISDEEYRWALRMIRKL